MHIFPIWFLTCDFGDFWILQTKFYHIPGIWRKFWFRYIRFLCKYLFNDLFWRDLDQARHSTNQARWRHMVKWPSLSMAACKMTHTTCAARRALDFYSLATFCDLNLTLIFPSMIFVLMYTFWRHIPAPWVSWGLCGPSNLPEGPKY